MIILRVTKTRLHPFSRRFLEKSHGGRGGVFKVFNISSEYFIIVVTASIKSYYLHELLVTSHYFSKPTYLRISLYNLAIAVKQSYGFEVESPSFYTKRTPWQLLS